MLVQLLEKFNSEQFDSMAINLQRILYNHFRRIGQFHKALITRTLREDYDYEEDVNPYACTFGQWYYSQTAPELTKNKDFIALGKSHEDLHKKMRDLLNQARDRSSITADRYDLFLKTYNLFTDKLMELINNTSFGQFQFDPLTNLLNRRAFKKIMEYEFNLLQRNKRSCSIAMADIDHFKKINDKYGHVGGDIVLKSIAEYFLKKMRKYDTVARFGGEEFVFCLPNTTLVSAKKIMARLCRSIEHMSIRSSDGRMIAVTISIGIAELKAASTVDKSLHNVDKALYQAKGSGRNRVEVSSRKVVNF
jgi:diguanylate cyclase